MAKIKGSGQIALNITLDISESEANALAHLAKYNSHEVVKVLSERISGEFSGGHQKGLELFLHSLANLHPILNRADKARRTFNIE